MNTAHATTFPGTLPGADPRGSMTTGALAAASHNGFPIVARHVQRRDRLGPLAGVTCALVLGGFTFWSLSSHRMVPVAAPESAIPQAAVLPEPLPVVPRAALSAPTAPLPVTQIDPALFRQNAPALVMDAGSAPQAADKASAGPVARAANTSPASGQPVARTPAQPLTADESFAERIGSSSVDTASASRLADPANTVVQGTVIAAVLETAIDSDLPGYARAVVSQDIRSFDGTRVLVPRASHLIGQYKSGVANGQKRAYVLWSRLIRPDGVSVALGSPATDFAGNSGLAGDVDTHFFARFGSAVMLSVVDLFAAIGSAAVVISGSSQSAASVAAQRDGQIPPTIRVPQGSPIRVFTARDLDFSTVAAVAAAP